MKTSLPAEAQKNITARLALAMAGVAKRFPGESGGRQPVHTVYGGAHLFNADTPGKLAKLAARSFETFAPDESTFAAVLGINKELSPTVFERVGEKLHREAVEDLRLDFEDGYGVRSDEEEDGHAVMAAVELVKALETATLPPFCGIRIKALTAEMMHRSIRTLDLFLTALIGRTGGILPDNFVVTLPKIDTAEQVRALVSIFDEIEPRLRLAPGSLRMEMMIETTRSIISDDGEAAIPKLLAAADGRCVAAHFGAYDYTATCGITSAYQDMLHPASDFARSMMQVSLAGTGVWLSDGATNVMPIPPHRGGSLTELEADENRAVVHRAWKLHYDHCRHSLANGFYQGWDLHPAQLPTRYAAVYSFFLEGLDDATARLKNFVEKAAQATMVGDVFDDAATGQGLLNYFLRAVNCGAITAEEATSRTGLTMEEFRNASFQKILDNRKV